MATAPETTRDLLEMEASAYMYIDGVTTVTFFDGPIPLEQLKERLVKVVQASPWLAGRLVRSKKDKKVIQMAFDASPTAELVLDDLLVQIEEGNLSNSMPCEAMIERIKTTKAHVAETGFGLLKKSLPYTRMTIAKIDAARWALGFSVSHVVADGYTYYKALAMLSKDAEISALNPSRRHFFVEALKTAVGAKEYATVMGAPAMLLNYAGNMLFGGKPRVRAFYVDSEKVAEAKKRSTGTDFVSTNDVITAWWGRLTGARLVEMAVNFRGRFPELKGDDAGNYEGCILFSRDDMEEGPASVRKALQRKDGKFQSTLEPPRPLPGFCEMRRCKYRIITNWASFFSHLDFDDCTQTLHIPYMAPGSLPTDLLVVFKPTKDTHGVFIVTRKLSDEQLTGADSLLGSQLMPPATGPAYAKLS